MTLYYRTGKRWYDPAVQRMLRDFRFDDHHVLIVDLYLTRAVELKKDRSLLMAAISQWLLRGIVYDTCGGGVVKLDDGVELLRIRARED